MYVPCLKGLTSHPIHQEIASTELGLRRENKERSCSKVNKSKQCLHNYVELSTNPLENIVPC